MNNLKKLNRGGKSIGLLLFLFLMLGNVGAWATDYKKITSDTDLEDGKNYLLVYESGTTGYIMGGISGDFMSSVSATINNNVLTCPTNANVIVLGKTTSGYTLKTTLNNQYLYGTTSTKLGTNATINDNTTWTIDFVNGNAQIKNIASTKTTTTRYAKFYTSNNTFRAYGSTNGAWISLYKEIPSDPAINASDVTYAADVTKGEISYTISNASGSTLTAESSTTWISKVAVADDMVTFDMEENTATEPREGVIELTYGTLTKEVKVTQLAAVAKRTVTIIEPENGTLQILRDGEEVVSGSQVPEGTVLTAVVTPNEGYKFDNWIATDGSTHTYTANFTYTVGKSDVTFKANFKQIIYNTIKWSVNGVTTTETVEQGTDITFTAPTTIPEGYVFTGWYGGEYTNATTAPEYVTSATATEDVTYYAVFAKSEGGSGEQTLELTNERIQQARSEASSTSGYQNITDIDGWTGRALYYKSGNLYALQIGTSNNAKKTHLTTPELSYPIKSITINTNNNTKDRTVYLCDDNTLDYGTEEKAIYGSGSTEVANGSITIDVKNNPTQLSIYAGGGTIYIASVTLTYGEPPVLSDFRTSVPVAPTTATISISSACTDGSLCYGTFSSTKPFVVPGDVKVSEINITEEGELLVKSYDPGAVVPANTGVMVAALAGDNYEVNLTDEAGTSVLEDRNMLRPTGAGITADQMATADPNCLYYRLTMHQGETLGFFWGAADGAAFNVAAGKAYLAVPVTQAARVNGFVLGGGTSTGIDSIADSMAAQRTVYNLQGQRVSGRLAKGVYIVNGKKIIIK